MGSHAAPDGDSASYDLGGVRSTQQKPRLGRGPAGGKSSAEPDLLRTFVSQSRASNQRMEQELSRVRTSWAGFKESCSWVRIEAATFVNGFDRLLAENESYATWIAHVASTFEAAGSNSLSSQALDLASTALSPISDATLLKAIAALPAKDISAMLSASSGLQAQMRLIDPVKINEWWPGLNPPQEATTRFSVQQGLLLTSLPVLDTNHAAGGTRGKLHHPRIRGFARHLQTASDLNPTHVYSGHARNVIPWLEAGQGDQWAWTGREFSSDHQVNPMSPEFGSHAFGTDAGGDTGEPVTDHGTSVGEGGAGYLDPETESLSNVVHAIIDEPEKMTPRVQQGPTDLQRILDEVASGENYSL